MDREKGEDVLKYWDDLEVMFATEGWRKLCLEINAEVYQLQADALDAQSWDIVNELRGRARALAYVVGLPKIVEIQRKQLADSQIEETE